jgi:hypothetical protein
MRFMMLMIPDGYATAQPDQTPDAAAVAAMMKYNEQLKEAGVLLSLDGLHPPSDGARVTFKGNSQPQVGHGPFSGATEALGGYWMIRVNSQQEAIDWARRCPVSHDAVIEIRQVFEMEEFPADVRAAAGDFPDRMKQAQH